MCFRGGGGQRSMVKDHKMTIFLGPFPKVNERFWLKEGLMDGFQNMVRMLDNLFIKLN